MPSNISILNGFYDTGQQSREIQQSQYLMTSQDLVDALRDIDPEPNDYVLTLVEIEKQGIAEAKAIDDSTGLDRARTLRYIKPLISKGIVGTKIKPGTERKHRPTNLYFLAQGVTKEVVQAAYQILGSPIAFKNASSPKKRQKGTTPSSQSLLQDSTVFTPTSIDKSLEELEPSQIQDATRLPMKLSLNTQSKRWAERLLEGFPEFDASWSKEAQENWINSLGALIRVIEKDRS